MIDRSAKWNPNDPSIIEGIKGIPETFACRIERETGLDVEKGRLATDVLECARGSKLTCMVDISAHHIGDWSFYLLNGNTRKKIASNGEALSRKRGAHAISATLPNENGDGLLQWQWNARHNLPIEVFLNCLRIKIGDGVPKSGSPLAHPNSGSLSASPNSGSPSAPPNSRSSTKRLFSIIGVLLLILLLVIVMAGTAFYCMKMRAKNQAKYRRPVDKPRKSKDRRPVYKPRK